jgi:hypothetical protein
MAQQIAKQDPTRIASKRYTEQRLPTYVGGSIDPETGNLIPATKTALASPSTATTGVKSASTEVEDTTKTKADQLPELDYSPPKQSTPTYSQTSETLVPQLPTTQLGQISYPQTSAGDMLSSVATNVGLGLATQGLTKSIGGMLFGGSDSSKSSGGSTSSNGFAGSFGGGNTFSESVPGGGSAGGGSALDSWNEPSGGGSELSSGGSGDWLDQVSNLDPLPFWGTKESDWTPPAPEPTSNYYFEPQSFYESGPSYSYDSGSDDGSKVICTELHRRKILNDAIFLADQRFGAMVASRHPTVYAGYIRWASSVVRLMQRSLRFTNLVAWVALPWAEVMATRMGLKGTPTLRGIITFHVGWAVCGTIGSVTAAFAMLRHPNTTMIGG